MHKNNIEFLIFFGAFLIRTTYALFVQLTAGAHGFISYSDAEFFYLRLANNFIEHHFLSVMTAAPFVPDAFHTPLYPLFLAAQLAAGIPLFGIVVVQSILAALSVVLMYRIALQFFSQRIAIAAAVLAAVEPMAMYWNGLLMSDTLFAFFFLLAIYTLMRRRYVFLGIALGLAMLTRPIMLYLTPIFFAMSMYLEYGAGHSWAKMLRGVLIAGVCMALTIFPWFLHNKLTAGVWAFSSAGWHQLYVLPLQEFAGRENLTVPNVPMPEGAADLSRYEFRFVPFYKETFFSLVAHDPVGYGVVHLQRSMYSLVSNRYAYLVDIVMKDKLPFIYNRLSPWMLSLAHLLGYTSWIIIYLFAAITCFRKDLLPWTLFFLALVGAHLVLAGAINPEGTEMSRYTLALQAFFFPYAVAGAGMAFRWWKGSMLQSRLWRSRNSFVE